MSDKSIFRRYKPKRKAGEKAAVVTCPNCHRKTIRDESYSCQWCRYPLAK